MSAAVLGRGISKQERPVSLAVGLSVAAAVAWFASPILIALHSLWMDSYTYSHGYLVAALSAALVVKATGRQRLRPSFPSMLALCALALCIAGILAARASNVQILALLLFPGLVWSAFALVAGLRNGLRMLAPAAFLFFAIPVWDLLIEPLQTLTTDIVAQAVRMTSIPAFIDDNMIHIPSGTFEIAGGCSGLHFFIVAVAMSVFFSLWCRLPVRNAVLLIAVSAAAGLCTNWVRVFSLVVIGHITEMQHYLIRVDHLYYGWALFVVVLAPVLLLAGRLDRRGEGTPSTIVKGAGPNTAGTVATVTGARAGGSANASTAPSELFRSKPAAGRRAVVVVGLGIVVAGTGIGQRMSRAIAAIDVPLAIELPEFEGWLPAGEWVETSRPHYPSASTDTARWYARGSDVVGVYLAHYAVQRQGQEAVFYANRPHGLAGRVISSREHRAAPMPVMEFVVADPPGGQRVVWLTMRIAGRGATSDLVAKGFQALGAVEGRYDAQVLLLSTACSVDCVEARTALSDLMPRAAAAIADVIAAAEAERRAEPDAGVAGNEAITTRAFRESGWASRE